jgi:hypothetical protein
VVCVRHIDEEEEFDTLGRVVGQDGKGALGEVRCALSHGLCQ